MEIQAMTAYQGIKVELLTDIDCPNIELARRTHQFSKPGEIDSGEIAHFPVIIASGGPVGLATV